MSWQAFCIAFSESPQVRGSFDTAGKIKDGALKQPFKTRASVDSETLVGILLEKKYIILTDDEFVQKFKKLIQKEHIWWQRQVQM